MFSYELNDFVVPPVLISDMAGGAVSEYNLGTSYIFHIEFAETAEAQWEYFYDEQAGEYHLIYQLPPEIKIPLQIEEENPYPIWGLPSMPGQPPPIVGHYNVFTDGSVKVHFDNVDIYGNSVAPTNFIDYYTDASFTMEIIAQFAHVGTQQVIDFGNNAIITVDVLNPIDGKLDVRKTYATFDLRNENMTFTIAVTAQDDEVHDITITDFNPIGDNLNKAIFKAMTVSVQGGAAYTPPEFTALDGQLFGDGFTLAFPAITLQPGEQIIVEFTLNFTDLIVELTSGGQSTAGTFEYSIYVNNAAFAEGIDSDLTPVISETFIVRNILLSRDFFRKSAHTDLTNDYTAYWDNIRVGDGVTPLNDATISDNFDEMFFVGTYVEFSLQDTNNITIARWRKPIGPNTSDFSITLPDETEAVLAETRPDGTVVTPLRTGQYGEIVYVYISTYSTIVADPTADFENTYTRRYTNRLGVSIGGENPFIEVTAGIVKSGAFPEASKVNEYVYSDGAPIGIQWTVTTVIPASCYGENVNFFDDVWVNVYESDIWTRYYLFDPQPFREMTVEASDESGTRELIEGVDYTLNTPASGGWRMYFVGQNSPSPFDEDTTLTFTYTIPLDALVAHLEHQMTVEEALQSFE
ncbi:MAG: hypothetical protein LBE35_05890, partial [Clostridiales bacterium]|nr:hypothetical protein [Clostridiales bacterium]